MIIGNGLGMAVNADYFSLPTGLNSVWSDTDHLSEKHKALIRTAIGGTDDETSPQSEDQLDLLQVAIIAAEVLTNFESADISWLTDPAKELPIVFKKYVHKVALYYHQSGEALPDSFVNSLSEFINQTKSHIATLNYDNLLYDALAANDVLSGYDGALLDGFWTSTGFRDENLDRKDIDRNGWYLHLHGSPLYTGNNKAAGWKRAFLEAEDNNHIVLTHVKHKPLIIASSNILSSYWRRLSKALDESHRIILFGYSGLDTHLNKLLKLHMDKTIKIIEWSGAGDMKSRESFWKRKLNQCDLEVLQFDNILDFEGWAD